MIEQNSKTILNFVFFSLTRTGLEWVVIFFVLSGFLVGGKTLEKLRKKQFVTKTFVLDRFTRIFVPLIPALILSWVISRGIGNTTNLKDLIGNLLGFQNVWVPVFAKNAPLWSLSYEIWFYILVGTIASIISSRKKTQKKAIIILIFSGIILGSLNKTYIYCLIIGTLSFYINSKISLLKVVFYIFIMFFGVCVSQLSSKTTSEINLFILKELVNRENGILILAIGSGLFISLISKCKPLNKKQKKIEMLGSKMALISYTLYLTHYPILLLFEKTDPQRSNQICFESIFKFSKNVVGCLFVSLIMFYLFERQTEKIKQKLLLLNNKIFHK